MPENPVRRRVAIKFRPEVKLPYDGSARDLLKERAGHAWSELSELFSGIAFEPFFLTIDEATLRRLNNVEPIHGSPPFAFTSYFGIICPDENTAERVAAIVGDWASVLTAYVEGRVSRPAVNASDDPLSDKQNYLDPAPWGIDARHAWDEADGFGASFVDLECGWKFDHEDLAAAGITLIWGDESATIEDIDHGTCALGVVRAEDNGLGGIGVAPRAAGRVVSHLFRGDDFQVAEAILKAVLVMNAGDVLLIEIERKHSVPTGKSVFPVEIEQANFDAIQNAVSQEITVVEAAGNGEYDLDTMVVGGDYIFKRSVRDSGAILVAAATSDDPHTRMEFSNYGSRIDCYAWGVNIVTSACFAPGNKSDYTFNFTGTSGASAIVAGAALLLQSWRKGKGLATYLPAEMRSLLADKTDGVNTKSAFPDTDRIGVMPNLQMLMPKSSSSISQLSNQHSWQAIQKILFGVVHDGGGLVWPPGKGPVPVDPWDPVGTMSSAERDLMVGLALKKLTGLLNSASNRREMRKSARRLVRRAAKKVLRDN